ncbi:MAG: hypothetical protein LH631_11305 [Alkalinema sp. CAN_BIN05]|nr:hypothetical protein [Alkalinema sp. CAN_BIN05]
MNLGSLLGECLLLLPVISDVQQWWTTFSQSPDFKTLSAIVTVLTAISGTVTARLEVIQKLLQVSQKVINLIKPAAALPAALTDTAEPRKRLLRILKSEYARRLQDSSLNLQVSIDLQFQDRRELVGRPRVRLGSLTMVPQSLEAIYSQIEIDGKLLIVGNPGSGKSTEVLKFATLTLERAGAETMAPIPVLLDLSAWDDEAPTLEHWIARRLKRLYNIDSTIALEWLRDESLILLLDSLNEVGLDRQERCIDAINQFLQTTSYPHCVVCCRLEEYELGRRKLTELNGAIYLQPLSDEQIQRYLEMADRTLRWETLQAEPTLRELVRSPLMLMMMVAVYQGRQIHTATELLGLYIDQCFERSLKPTAWQSPSRAQTIRYLTWLARQLKVQSKPELAIERMQPSWLGNKHDRILYRLLCGVIISILCGLIFTIINLNLDLLPEIQVFGIAIALAGGMLYGVYSREDLWDWLQALPILSSIADLLDNEEIEPVRLGWSWRRFKMGLLAGLSVGAILGIGILVHHWILGNVWLGLRWGAAVFVSYGCFIAVISGLQAGVRSSASPNQGIWESLKNTAVVIVLATMIGSLIARVVLLIALGIVDARFSLWVGIGSGLMSGLFSGGLPCIQHGVLRLLLWRQNVIPWNYAKFLEYAHNIGLLQQVGGRYRFVHELLRRHFDEHNARS